MVNLTNLAWDIAGLVLDETLPAEVTQFDRAVDSSLHQDRGVRDLATFECFHTEDQRPARPTKYYRRLLR